MYVAITRAEERLYLTRSKSRYLYGHRDITAPSRFINELAAELGVTPQRTYGGGYNNSYGSYGYGGRPARALYSEDADYTPPTPSATSSFKAFWGGVKDAKKAQEGGKFTVGMRVKHPKFGMGMIIAVKNNGNTINVAFDGQGIKELSASLAPLEIIR